MGEPNIEKMKAEGDVEGLIEALKDKDVFVRKRAAEALFMAGDLRAVDSLAEAMMDDEGVKRVAEETLAKIALARTAKPLAKALEDKDKGVRLSAAGALGKMGYARGSELLIQALGDKDWSVRLSAAYALGNIGDVGAVGPLTEALKDEAGRVREAAKEALENIKS